MSLTPMQREVVERLKEEENTMSEPSLDDALDQLTSELTPEPEVEVEEYPDIQDVIRNDVMRLLLEHPDYPGEAQIQTWKDHLGDDALQVWGLDKNNVFIYTHITLLQWEKIQAILQQIQPGTVQAAEAEKTIREQVIRSAVLWPRLEVDFFKKCRAGLPQSLYELIMLQSYFLTPQQAISLTTQL